MEPLGDQWFEEQFRANYKSSSATIYVGRMRAVVRKIGALSFWHLMTQPDAYWADILDNYKDSVGTRRAICTLVLAAYKWLPDDLRADHVEAHKRWTALNKTAAVQHEDELLGEKSERQKANWVKLEEIRAKAAELSQTNWNVTRKSSLQFLLLQIYATMPPVRSDLGAIKIYDEDPETTDDNYLVLHDGTASYLVFNRYKTAKRYKRVTSELTPETTRAITESLRRHRREYLFVNRYGLPFVDNHSYGLFVQNMFRALFGRAAGTSLLRHVYITESGMWRDEVDPKERKEIHRRMMHSGEMASEYRKVVKEPGKTVD